MLHMSETFCIGSIFLSEQAIIFFSLDIFPTNFQIFSLLITKYIFYNMNDKSRSSLFALSPAIAKAILKTFSIFKLSLLSRIPCQYQNRLYNYWNSLGTIFTSIETVSEPFVQLLKQCRNHLYIYWNSIGTIITIIEIKTKTKKKHFEKWLQKFSSVSCEPFWFLCGTFIYNNNNMELQWMKLI